MIPPSEAPPTPQSFERQLDALRADVDAAVGAAADADAVEALRVRFLGRKSGWMTTLSKALGTLSPADKPDAGKRFNDAKEHVERLLGERLAAVLQVSTGQTVDLTMPARRQWRGGRHPVTVVMDEVAAIFRELGFTIALGPEAETAWYNFGSLNFPADHPAMDLHDTLYLEGAPARGAGGAARAGDVLLRTHTSPVQMRTLQRHAPPIRVLVPGNVYRRDFFDPSHAPMFAQIEGLCVDEGISFVDLKATLTHVANRLFGATRTRFRPSFFPFTEPSAEMDVRCLICGGRGCASCKGTGWMEIVGSGMVHPALLENAGLDPDRYTGWAFGMGPARMATLLYGIPDIRLLYDSDVRLLEQLAR